MPVTYTTVRVVQVQPRACLCPRLLGDCLCVTLPISVLPHPPANTHHTEGWHPRQSFLFARLSNGRPAACGMLCNLPILPTTVHMLGT